MSTVEATAVLTPAEREAIAALAHGYEAKRGACIEALRTVQRSRGWISDEALGEIAQLLEMSSDELDGVATFYNLVFRRPVGRHVVLICDSVSCWIMGYEALRDRIHARLGVKWGETTADGRFTVLPIVCLGACDHAPTLMIDDDLHRDVDPDQLDSVLEKYP
ncbi:MAG: NADH-quinone oxidoreductase subunit NuoE [Acetobacteraceae bacterium]